MGINGPVIQPGTDQTLTQVADKLKCPPRRERGRQGAYRQHRQRRRQRFVARQPADPVGDLLIARGVTRGHVEIVVG